MWKAWCRLALIACSGWPEALVSRLAECPRVVRYDHRDTGRSTSVFDTHPYAVCDLAEDAVAVLDAVYIDQAHVVGMSLGSFSGEIHRVWPGPRCFSGAACTRAHGPASRDRAPRSTRRWTLGAADQFAMQDRQPPVLG